jgi:hypothetical protein
MEVKMKLSLILVLVLSLVLVFAVNPVLAQEPAVEAPFDWGNFLDKLFSIREPGSMVQAVEIIAALLAGYISLSNLTQVITNALKKINWGWLTLGQKEKLGGEIAEVVAYLVAVGLTYGTTHWLLPLAEQVDTLGIWGIGLAVWAFARTIYFSRKPNARPL